MQLTPLAVACRHSPTTRVAKVARTWRPVVSYNGYSVPVFVAKSRTDSICKPCGVSWSVMAIAYCGAVGRRIQKSPPTRRAKGKQVLGEATGSACKAPSVGEKGSGLAAWAAVHAVFDHFRAEFELGIHIPQCGTYPLLNHWVIEGHI